MTLLLLICIIDHLHFVNESTQTIMAHVEQRGISLDIFDLSQISDPLLCTYYASDGHGCNRILVEPGRVRVLEANCPEQIDVNAGWLFRPGQSAICLPHRFVVYLVAAKASPHDLDAVIK